MIERSHVGESCLLPERTTLQHISAHTRLYRRPCALSVFTNDTTAPPAQRSVTTAVLARPTLAPCPPLPPLKARPRPQPSQHQQLRRAQPFVRVGVGNPSRRIPSPGLQFPVAPRGMAWEKYIPRLGLRCWKASGSNILMKAGLPGINLGFMVRRWACAGIGGLGDPVGCVLVLEIAASKGSSWRLNARVLTDRP